MRLIQILDFQINQFQKNTDNNQTIEKRSKSVQKIRRNAILRLSNSNIKDKNYELVNKRILNATEMAETQKRLEDFNKMLILNEAKSIFINNKNQDDIMKYEEKWKDCMQTHESQKLKKLLESDEMEIKEKYGKKGFSLIGDLIENENGKEKIEELAIELYRKNQKKEFNIKFPHPNMKLYEVYLLNFTYTKRNYYYCGGNIYQGIQRN